MYKILSKTAPNLKKKVNLIYFRQFHYTTQWNNDLLIPLSGVMKLTYPLSGVMKCSNEWDKCHLPHGIR
jgi:hypothetical protein